MKIAVFQFCLFGINTYIAWDEESLECAIIDPGMINDREEKAITDFIERNHLTVKHLLNTHLHVDHAVGNGFVISGYDVKTEASEKDAFLGKHLTSQLENFGIPREAKGVEIGITLRDGDKIDLGKSHLDVIEVPGHSPGGLAFYSPDGHFLISGDSLFNGSIGRTDLPGGNHHQLVNSVREKLLSLPAETVVYPGHGDPTTVGYERNHNPFLR